MDSPRFPRTRKGADGVQDHANSCRPKLFRKKMSFSTACDRQLHFALDMLFKFPLEHDQSCDNIRAVRVNDERDLPLKPTFESQSRSLISPHLPHNMALTWAARWKTPLFSSASNSLLSVAICVLTLTP